MKIVNVSQSDYKVKVRDGGDIILYTGNQVGTVTVSGDLLVLGNTTTVESETMTVKDNIIVLNSGETGSGVTLGSSGLQIDRGPSTPDSQFVWDENETHFNPTTAITEVGTWVFRRDNGTLTGIQTNSIDTNQGRLGLINSGSTGYVTVTGTANYERNVLTYTDTITYNPAAGVTINFSDDDIIPNSKAMSDFVIGSLSTWLMPDKYGSGNTIAEATDTVSCVFTASFNLFTMTVINVTSGRLDVGHIISGIGITPGTTITGVGTGSGLNGTYTISVSHSLPATAITSGDTTSAFTFKVDNNLEATIASNGLTIGNLNIDGNTMTSSSGNIVLDPNNNNLQVDAHISLIDQVGDPSAVASMNKLYSKTTLGPGDTGLYFVNTSEADELVSRKRAILFGFIF